MHQLDDNLASVNVRLTQDDLAALDAATALTPIHPDGTAPDRVTQKALSA